MLDEEKKSLIFAFLFMIWIPGNNKNNTNIIITNSIFAYNYNRCSFFALATNWIMNINGWSGEHWRWFYSHWTRLDSQEGTGT